MMLTLAEGKELPALRRALPIFEEILSKNNLHLVPPSSFGQSNHRWHGEAALGRMPAQ